MSGAGGDLRLRAAREAEVSWGWLSLSLTSRPVACLMFILSLLISLLAVVRSLWSCSSLSLSLKHKQSGNSSTSSPPFDGGKLYNDIVHRFVFRIVCQECQAAVTLFLVTLLSCEISAMECDAKRHRPGEHKVELELQLKIVTSSPVRQSWLPYQRNQQVINFVICSSQLSAHSSQLTAHSSQLSFHSSHLIALSSQLWQIITRTQSSNTL